MTETQVYWWLMLDSVRGFSIIYPGVTIGLGVIGGVLLAVGFGCPWECDEKKLFNGIRIGVINLFFWTILSTLLVFVPSSKQYAMIKIFPQIVNSDVAKEIPADMENMYTIAKDYMKGMLKGSDD